MPEPRITQRLEPFSTSIFTEMTRLAIEHKAINLSQGFPDFDGPEFVKQAAAEAIEAGHNQYARPFGEPLLVEEIAAWYAPAGLTFDPMTEITVTSGCTEAMICIALGLLEPGDEVVAFEPFYDSYPAVCSVAGARLVGVALRPPADPDEPFVFDEAELRRAITPRTRVILLNTPHNPTGKVFTREELRLIADIAIEHDLLVIADEVYEKLVYGVDHIAIASLPGMRDRTITCSSLGKTFSITGWKIGWAAGPAHLQAGIRAAHQYTVFTSATPLQHAAAVALREGSGYVADLVSSYQTKRNGLVEGLRGLGFHAYRPDGSYFVLADHSAMGFADDVELCRHLTTELGVAAIPPSAFYEHKELGKSLVRFAFCKRDETLSAALERMAPLAGRVGGGV